MAEPHPDIARIERISTNARSAWFGLIALLVFVATTLLGHRDADFFAFGAATQLPLVGISVPPERFFIAAPILVASVYIYLHLYLLTLWDAIGQAPPAMAANRCRECIFPWLLASPAVWYRNRCRQDASAPPRALGGIMLMVNLALTWVGGLGVSVLALDHRLGRP